MSRSKHQGDFELLRLHNEAFLDDRGRVVGLCGITIASAEDGQGLWIGADVPEALAAELEAVFESAAASTDPAMPPPALEPCERLLSATCAPVLRAGPYYLIGPDVRFRSGARVERSDASNGDGLRSSNPGNWHPVEWEELLDGRLGPWAMATESDRVISICHTPISMTDRTAECGVWTHPDFRGRGHAAAVTAEWAAILKPSGRHLFYSTDDDNSSSQRVAQRLNLRPLGWTWQLRRPTDDADERFHPLGSLRVPPTSPPSG
jgi:hypothetical protein